MAKRINTVDMTNSRDVRRALERDDAWGPIYLGTAVGEPVAHACGLCGAVVSTIPEYRQAHIEFHANVAVITYEVLNPRPVIRNA